MHARSLDITPAQLHGALQWLPVPFIKVSVPTPGACSGEAALQTNFVSDKPSSWYSHLYQRDGLTGGHVIMLGADDASKYVVSCYAHVHGSYCRTKAKCAAWSFNVQVQHTVHLSTMHEVLVCQPFLPGISAAAVTHGTSDTHAA